MFQRKVIEAYKRHGWLVFNISDRFTSGVPDLYCARGGVSIWREVKKLYDGENKMRFSKPQKIKIYQLRQAGVDASGLLWVPDHQTAFFIPPEDFDKTIPRKDFPKLYPAFDFDNPS